MTMSQSGHTKGGLVEVLVNYAPPIVGAAAPSPEPLPLPWDVLGYRYLMTLFHAKASCLDMLPASQVRKQLPEVYGLYSQRCGRLREELDESFMLLVGLP